jgi:succinyl-CoA synthetase alpha subunit
VSPSKGGSSHLSLPVYSTISEAAQSLKPHATCIFVPALQAATAITDAIAAEIPLIVAVAEGIPIHDMLRVHEVLRTQSKSRLVGPNSPGIIAPPARCRVGFMPYKMYSEGVVGIVSKSGTLSYEAVGATTSAGLGQSLVVGMGGDPLPGTTFVDALRHFFKHEGTEGIILIGEIGGEAEFEAAELIKEYRSKGGAKPIIAMVAGQTAPEGRVMGHAGALLGRGDKTAKEKAVALEKAGARVVAHPGEMGGLMTQLLGRKISS